MAITKDEIDAMSPAEKLGLLDMLWRSIEGEEYIDDADDETQEEKRILRERLNDYRTNPSTGINWKDLKDELTDSSHD